MINWIVGGAIVMFTGYIIIKSLAKIKNGESLCGSCDSENKNCNCKK